MTPEKEQQIYDIAPRLFGDLESQRKAFSQGEMHKPIALGIDCDDGWFQIIFDCAKKIEAEIQKTKARSIRAFQIKEKFGGLRFYLSSETDSISKIIREAERASLQTCELCGEKGEPRSGPWIKTLCDGCAALRGGDNE